MAVKMRLILTKEWWELVGKGFWGGNLTQIAD